MICPDHIEQIERLLVEYFGGMDAGLAWLANDFDAKHPRDLLTAKRAGQVIHVLKGMTERRQGKDEGCDTEELTPAGSTSNRARPAFDGHPDGF